MESDAGIKYPESSSSSSSLCPSTRRGHHVSWKHIFSELEPLPLASARNLLPTQHNHAPSRYETLFFFSLFYAI
jgi:hypothetical protein